MAARTSTGIGVGVTVTILGVLTLALFVTTVVFMSQKQAAQKKLIDLQEGVKDYVRENEQQRDDVQQLKSLASKDRPPASVVGYLINQRQEAMRLATGSKATTPEELTKTLASFPGGENSNLVAMLRDREAALANEKKAREDADAARIQALQDRQNEVARVKSIEDNNKATIVALNAQLDNYKKEVDQYRDEVQKAKDAMDVRVDKIQAEAQDKIASLNSQTGDLQKEVVLGRDTISRLQGELKGRSYKPTDEFALVDGRVIGLDPAENHVYLGIGAKQKVRVGLTFEVYSEAGAIRPDERTGNYPPGKASIEVIKVDENSSTARVIREKRGNPVLRGDVIANAVYDPNKVYTFLVFGNFDANHDGIATAQEANDVRALIESWGGKVTDTLSGNVDFLVLGDKPVLPPQPIGGAPAPIIEEYIRLRRITQQYDDLFKKATETSIPVLNENRLYTLIGKRMGL